MANRRAVLKGLLTTVCAAAVGHCGLAPRETEYDPKDITPTPEQLSALTLLSQRNDFLAIGDTEHRQIFCKLFLYHPSVVTALQQGGKKDMFIERSPKDNALLSPETSKQDFQEACPDRFVGDWIYNDAADRDFCDALRGVIEREGIDVTAIDQRLVEGEGKISLGFSAIPLRVFAEIQETIYGESNLNAPFVFLSAVLTVFSHLGQLTDDTKTTEALLQNYPEGGVIFYGAGHFQDMVNENNQRVDMPSLIRDAGKTIVTVNLYETDAERNKYYESSDKFSDMDLIVFPSRENPHGIHLNNPDLLPLYQQAMAAGQQHEASAIGLD